MSKSSNGKIIVELSYQQKIAQFSLSKTGVYSIWQKGQLYRRTPLNQLRPAILDNHTNQFLRLNRSLLRLNLNDGFVGRMEISTFFAVAGLYSIELTEGSGLSAFETALSSLIPVKKQIDLTKYFIQVRESQPVYFSFFGLLLIVLSVGCVVGGLVLGTLADQFIK